MTMQNEGMKKPMTLGEALTRAVREGIKITFPEAQAERTYWIWHRDAKCFLCYQADGYVIERAEVFGNQLDGWVEYDERVPKFQVDDLVYWRKVDSVRNARIKEVIEVLPDGEYRVRYMGAGDEAGLPDVISEEDHELYFSPTTGKSFLDNN